MNFLCHCRSVTCNLAVFILKNSIFSKKKLIFLQIHIDIFFWKVYLLNYGSQSEEEIPVPIPNTEVKLFYADDTANAGK